MSRGTTGLLYSSHPCGYRNWIRVEQDDLHHPSMMVDVRNALTKLGVEDRQGIPREGGGVRHHCPLCGRPAEITRCPVCAKPFYRTPDRRMFCSRSCSGRG